MRCDFQDHANQYISANCTRKECDQQSTICQTCITQSHISCVNHLIYIKDLSHELDKFKSQYSQINEIFESLIQLLRYLQDEYQFQLLTIIEFNGAPNLGNLNQLGQFLRTSPLMNLETLMTGSELIKQIIDLIRRIKKILICMRLNWTKREKGAQHSQNNEFYKFIEYYDRALSINPKSNSFWNDKGQVLIQIKIYVEAMKCFNEALKINPTNSQTLYYKIHQLNHLQRFKEAYECCKKALHQNPHQYQFIQALVCLNTILEINPNDDQANKGITLKNQNKFQEAIQCFEQFLNIQPNHIRYYYKAYSLQRLNKLKEAEEYYLKALNVRSQLWTYKIIKQHLDLNKIMRYFKQKEYIYLIILFKLFYISFN